MEYLSLYMGPCAGCYRCKESVLSQPTQSVSLPIALLGAVKNEDRPAELSEISGSRLHWFLNLAQLKNLAKLATKNLSLLIYQKGILMGPWRGLKQIMLIMHLAQSLVLGDLKMVAIINILLLLLSLLFYCFLN